MPDDAALTKPDTPPEPALVEDSLRERVIAALKTVYDPEIPVDIYALGLIYRLDIDAEGKVEIDMTLTAPGCPVAGEMPGAVEQAVDPVEGVSSVRVELVWEPTWSPARMSEDAKLQLDMF